MQNFEVQKTSKGSKREAFSLKFLEINDADPIEASLKLRMKQGNLGEVVKDSCMLLSSEAALKRMETGKTAA